MKTDKYYFPPIQVGDEVLIYGKKTKVLGFNVSYNESLEKHEIIILTEGRGDPMYRTYESGNLKVLGNPN